MKRNKTLLHCLLIGKVLVISLCASAQIHARGPSSFPSSVHRVLPCVVRILGESTLEKVQEHMAESVVSADGKVFSVGSGFFISSDGRILTAYHVVAPITGDITVESRHTGNISQHKATILQHDKQADVALLKTEGKLPEFVDKLELHL